MQIQTTNSGIVDNIGNVGIEALIPSARSTSRMKHEPYFHNAHNLCFYVLTYPLSAPHTFRGDVLNRTADVSFVALMLIFFASTSFWHTHFHYLHST